MAAESNNSAETDGDEEIGEERSSSLEHAENASQYDETAKDSKSDEEDEELNGILNGDGSGSDNELDAETPADVAFAKTKRQEENILQLIANTKVSGSPILDLSKKDLQSLPDEMLELSHIEYMYLQGNQLAFLPDEFFKFFPNIKWLDLRHNELSRIPAIFLSHHQCLRDLLLEGNNLRDLPLELGLVRSLHGLNIAGNPLDFPPEEIIERGTQNVLAFLRSMMEAKNTAKMADLDLSLSAASSELPQDLPDGVSASSDDWNTTASMMDVARRRQEMVHRQQTGQGHGGDAGQDEYNIGARSAELHRPPRHSDNKYKHIQKLKKAGALGTVDKSLKEEVSPERVIACLRIKSLPLLKQTSLQSLSIYQTNSVKSFI